MFFFVVVQPFFYQGRFFPCALFPPLFFFGSHFFSEGVFCLLFDNKFRHFADFMSVQCHDFFFKIYLPLHALFFFFAIALFFPRAVFWCALFFALVFFFSPWSEYAYPLPRKVFYKKKVLTLPKSAHPQVLTPHKSAHPQVLTPHKSAHLKVLTLQKSAHLKRP